MTGWSIDLRPRSEPRASGASPAVAVTVFLALYGLTVSLGSLLFAR